MTLTLNVSRPRRCLALVFGPLLAGSAVMSIPAAHAAETQSVYAVTYLDVSTDWLLQGTGLLKQYRDSSRKEAGNLEFTVLQETARPNRFAIVEGWKDQASMDAHAKSADSKRFDFILEPIRNSPPNQHVVDPLATAPARPAQADAVYMVQHIDIAFNGFKPPVLAAIKALAGPSEKEPGTLRFDLYEESRSARQPFVGGRDLCQREGLRGA